MRVKETEADQADMERANPQRGSRAAPLNNPSAVYGPALSARADSAGVSPAGRDRVRGPAHRRNDEEMIQRDDVRPESPRFGSDDPHHRLPKLRSGDFTRHLDRHLRLAPTGHTRRRPDEQAMQLRLARDDICTLRLKDHRLVDSLASHGHVSGSDDDGD